MSGDYDLLIVGGGPAGLSAARSYREAGGGGAVAIVADERRVPYNRPPLTKELLRNEIEEDELPLEQEEWLSEQGIGLISGRAVALDPSDRQVTLSGGRRLAYDSCLLATGAEPARLPVPGADDPAVRVLRSLDDLRELKRRLEPGMEVIVIGSGFIGCEIAASLCMLGHPVTLMSDETAPNQRRLGTEASAEIQRWLQEVGVMLSLGDEVQRIERHGTGLEVHTSEHHAAANLVMMAAGVAPRSELAVAAGLKLEGGAVPTDTAMQTAVPGLLAAGDVCFAENAAAGRSLRVEHWGDALGQGKVAGATAAGAERRWDDVPGFWSQIGTRTLKYAAWGDGYQQVSFQRRANGAFTAWYVADGRVVGVLTHETDEDYEHGRELIREGAAWT